MEIRPLEDRLVVERDPKRETTESGLLYVPQAGQEEPLRGTVVAAGPGARNDAGELIPMDVGVGTRVMWGRFAGLEVEVEGRELVIVRADEILAEVP